MRCESGDGGVTCVLKDPRVSTVLSGKRRKKVAGWRRAMHSALQRRGVRDTGEEESAAPWGDEAWKKLSLLKIPVASFGRHIPTLFRWVKEGLATAVLSLK